MILDCSLTHLEKLLYSEISALCNNKGYCFATNNYLGKMNNVSERTIRTSISNLHSKGYIKVIIDRKEQNNSRRKIYINNDKEKILPSEWQDTS